MKIFLKVDLRRYAQPEDEYERVEGIDRPAFQEKITQLLEAHRLVIDCLLAEGSNDSDSNDDRGADIPPTIVELAFHEKLM